MWESSNSLLPPKLNANQRHLPLTVLILGENGDPLDELERLLKTLDVKVGARVEAQVRKIHPGTYIGMGKVEEVRILAEELKVDAVVVDWELSPNQLKNLEKGIKIPVIDRPGVILEIFFQHARSKEAKTQVELAKLQYLMPRLAHYWTHFERQRGGVGNKGMGEKQIEVDRRLLKVRIGRLRERLIQVAKERDLRRHARRDVLKVALVGYTNAGKSTLLNALTDSRVLVEDKLFSTLDSSVRALDPDSHPPVVAIDTVGFIERIPTHLVASFRSTLEEIQDADLLVHVVDASSARAKEQLETTISTLKELKMDEKPRIVVLNKMDQVSDLSQVNWTRVIAPGAIRLSALNREEVRQLREHLLGYFKKSMETIEVVIPYSEGKMDALLRRYAHIEVTKPIEKGIFYRLRIESSWAEQLELAKYKL